MMKGLCNPESRDEGVGRGENRWRRRRRAGTVERPLAVRTLSGVLIYLVKWESVGYGQSINGLYKLRLTQ